MKLFKSQMLHEFPASAEAIRVLRRSPRYGRRKCMHQSDLPRPRLLQLGHDQVALREPANDDIHRVA